MWNSKIKLIFSIILVAIAVFLIYPKSQVVTTEIEDTTWQDKLNHSLPILNDGSHYLSHVLLSPDKVQALVTVKGRPIPKNGGYSFPTPQDFLCDLEKFNCQPSTIISSANKLTGGTDWVGWNPKEGWVIGYSGNWSGAVVGWPIVVFNYRTQVLGGVKSYDVRIISPPVYPLVGGLSPSQRKIILFERQNKKLLIYKTDELLTPEQVIDLKTIKEPISYFSVGAADVTDFAKIIWSPNEDSIVLQVNSTSYQFDLLKKVDQIN